MAERSHIYDRNLRERVKKLAENDLLLVRASDITAMLAALDWYAERGGDDSITARLALGLIEYKLIIHQCVGCGRELVQVPDADGSNEPEKRPLCDDCKDRAR
jgi:hypothetical protein